MFVKVAKLGAAVKEVFVTDNAALADALEAAEVDSAGFQVRVNGRTPCETLKDGDVITLAPAIKGGVN